MTEESLHSISLEVTLDLIDLLAFKGDAKWTGYQLELFNKNSHACAHIMRDVAMAAQDPRTWILRGLEHSHFESRVTAAQMAGALRIETLIPNLAAHLKDGSDKVPPEIVKAILACASQKIECIQPVLDQLNDPTTCWKVFDALSYPHAIPEVLEVLLRFFDEHADDEGLCSRAGRVLTFYTDTETVLREMRTRLADPRTELCALFVLRDIGTAADLRPYLQHDNICYLRAAVKGMKNRAEPQDLPALQAALEKLLATGILDPSGAVAA